MTSDLAPNGVLRAGINYSNFILAARDPAGGEPRGIAAELAREIARRLNVAIEFVTFESAGAMADAVTAGAWDVAFLANEPQRAHQILFSPTYLEIEAAYLVPPHSHVQSMADADSKGLRIAVADKSAYDLFLSRTLKFAELVRAKGMDGSLQLLAAGKADVVAGLKPWLTTAVGKLRGSRILDGRFMAVQQCIGTPKGRDAGAAYLRDFVEDIKKSGFLTRVIRTYSASTSLTTAAADTAVGHPE
jgi:polar amino acid transport system substrate-binding protein